MVAAKAVAVVMEAKAVVAVTAMEAKAAKAVRQAKLSAPYKVSFPFP